VADLIAETHREFGYTANFQIAPEQSPFLTFFVRLLGVRNAVEVGTFTGLSSLSIARGLAPGGHLLCLDVSEEFTAVARRYWERAGVADRVELIEGAALEVLPRLPGPIDLAYVDAVKREYRRYLDQLVPKLRVGGVVALDNLLWKGLVADPPDEDDPDADALRAFNGYLMMHPQLQAVVLPFGDGLGVATKTKPTILEMGGPY